MRALTVASSVVVAWATACASKSGEEGATHEDAGVDTGDGGNTLGSAQLPHFLPCPEGWREVEDGPLTLCDPWPETGVSSCRKGAAHLPGQAGCARVASPCPDGDWPADLPTSEQVLYVRQGGSAGVGDGSRESPFETLADALLAADSLPGTDPVTLAIAGNRFVPSTFTPVASSRPLRFAGACPGRSIVQVRLDGGPETEFRDLDIRASATDANAVIADSFLRGMFLSSAVSGDSVQITGLGLSDTSNAAFTRASNGWQHLAKQEIEDGLVTSLPPPGIRIAQNSMLTLRDSIISAPRIEYVPAQEGPDGYLPPRYVEMPSLVLGSGGAAGSRLRLVRSVLCSECTQLAGDVELEHVWVGEQSVSACPDDVERCEHQDVAALDFTLGGESSAVLRKVVVEDSGRSAIEAWTTQIDAEDIVIREGRGAKPLVDPADFVAEGNSCPDHYGRGLNLEGGATLRGQRIFIDHARDVGVFAAGRSEATDYPTIEIEDLVLVRSLPQLCAIPSVFDDMSCVVHACENDAVVGVVARDEGRVSLQRFVIGENENAGIVVGERGHISLQDGTIEGHPIGASIQSDRDPDAFSECNVVWTDNDVDIDSASVAAPEPLKEWICDNGEDDDLDGRSDCLDNDCRAAPDC